MKKICVIFGGQSSEHDISIITGMQLCSNLKGSYEIEKIYLGLDNKFYLATKAQNLSSFANKNKLKFKEIVLKDSAIYLKNKKYCEIFCLINCCHGGVGENGLLAGFLEVNKIVYTSANPLASSIAMDKSLTKTLVKDIIDVVKGEKIDKDNFKNCQSLIAPLSDELIVKPNSLGSSIGVKACTKNNFNEQVEVIFALNDDALVEERVLDILEFNQACVKDENNLILSAIEQPISKSEFLTFDEKYNTSKTKGQDRIIPAKISKQLQEKISNTTQAIYKRLNMNGVVRIDYIYDKKSKKLYFNEINTIPGSLAFYLFEPKGIDYINLIEILIKNATKPKNYVYFDSSVLTKKLI